MKNKLEKTLNIKYTPGSPYVPGDPGQPYLPARTVTEMRWSCGYRTTYTARRWDDSLSAVDNKSGTSFSSNTTYVCGTYPVAVQVPAQPYRPARPAQDAVPGTVQEDFNLGWNAGGQSIATLQGLGAFSFQVPQGVLGVIVGLSGDDGSPYYDVDHAFYLVKGVAKVMQRGAVVGLPWAYTTDDVFSIGRTNDGVSYKFNGVEVLLSPGTPDGEVFLQAHLYAAGDAVFNPELSSESSGHGSLQPLTGLGSDAPYGVGVAVLQPLRVTSHPAQGGATSLLPLTGMGSDRPYAQAGVSMQPLEALGWQDRVMAPSYALGQGALGFLLVAGSGMTGTVGNSAGQLPPLMSLGADRPYGASAASLLPLETFAHAYEGPNEASIASVAFAAPYVTVAGVLAVTMNSVGQVTSIMQINLEQQADLISTAQVQTPMELDSALEAVMLSVLNARTSLGGPEDADTCWVVNVDNMASSRYENYGFNSFGMFQGRYVGVRQDGVYLLEGDTDDGDPIRAMISLGKQTFGTTQLKGLQCAYLGVASDDRMYLKVLVNEQEYIYEARRSDEYTRTQRIDTGKGLRANVYEFEIYNNEGCDFDLDSVEFVPVTFNRRI